MHYWLAAIVLIFCEIVKKMIIFFMMAVLGIFISHRNDRASMQGSSITPI